jgi:hypothetical protein
LTRRIRQLERCGEHVATLTPQQSRSSNESAKLREDSRFSRAHDRLHGALGIFKFILLVLGAFSLIQLAFGAILFLYIMLTVNQMYQMEELNSLIQALGRLG